MTLHWDIICPACRLSTGTRDTLREIQRHSNCDACQLQFDIEFSRSLELVFRAHPEIRSSDARTYCAGGPGNFPHVVAQVRLQPTERLILPMSLNKGSYIARGPSLPYAIPIEVDSQTGIRHGQIQCIPKHNCNPVSVLRAGHQSVVIENFFPMEQVVRIERTLCRNTALTAAQVAAMPLFRELFPEQVLAPGMLVEMATSSFLSIRLANFDQLFAEMQDAGAYSVMQDFRRIVARQIHQLSGSVIQIADDSLLAAFNDPVAAVKAIRSIPSGLAQERPERSWQIAGALHRGPALVTGDQNEVKYFGATINTVCQLSRKAEPNQVLMASEVWSDPGVQAEFEGLIPRSAIESLECGQFHGPIPIPLLISLEQRAAVGTES